MAEAERLTEADIVRRFLTHEYPTPSRHDGLSDAEIAKMESSADGDLASALAELRRLRELARSGIEHIDAVMYVARNALEPEASTRVRLMARLDIEKAYEPGWGFYYLMVEAAAIDEEQGVKG